MKRIAVVLSGCGVFDGAEIHESVLTLLYLDKAGAQVQCFAPDKDQAHVINHNTQQPAEGESRNVLVESARIARGDVKPLVELKMENFDAVFFPGGFGAAKNICTYAFDGDDCKNDPAATRVIRDAHSQGKPIGAMCIAPVIVARAFSGTGVTPTLTIGTDAAIAGSLRAMGAVNEPKSVSEITVDEQNKIVSTPAYMLGPSIAHVSEGIEKLINKVLEMA